MSLAYLIFGIMTGVVASRLHLYLKERQIRLPWFYWVLGGFWYLMCVGVLGFVVTSFQEREPQAASMAILLFGGGLLVLSFLGYRFGLRPRLMQGEE